MANKVPPIPEGMHTITPYLVCGGADAAMAFYKKAFGAVELSRVAAPDGKIVNAGMRIGNSMFMLMDEFLEMGGFGPKTLKGSPVTIHLQVQDSDAVFAQAVAAGCKVTMPLDDMFWGDRYGAVEDPFGHQWSVGTHKREVSPEEMQQAMAKMGG